jgi:hypothetical protein
MRKGQDCAYDKGLKTGRHDIAEILLKVALITKNKIKSIIY